MPSSYYKTKNYSNNTEPGTSANKISTKTTKEKIN